MVKEIFICSCSSLEHQMYFWYDEEYNFVYTEVHLTGRSFWRRLKYGIKYIFGYKCRFGAWDEFLFDDESEKKLNEFLNNKQNGKEKNKKNRTRSVLQGNGRTL